MSDPSFDPLTGARMPASPMPTAPPAGWYPDPQTPNRQRYWDGSTWGEHREAPLAPPWDGTTLPEPVRGPYSAARITGIIALFINPFLIVGILTIIFASVALYRGGEVTQRTGVTFKRGYGGGWLAMGIIDTVLGYIVFQILLSQ